MKSSAAISLDGLYRYDLARQWADSRSLTVLWIMLNPSTAGASADDPTIRRCIKFSDSWGAGALVVVNLYALRATDPKHLNDHPDPVGPGNTETIDYWLTYKKVGLVVAGWGGGLNKVKVAEPTPVVSLAKSAGRALFCLGHNSDRSPKHPLYCKGDLQPTRWIPRL